MAVNRVTWRIGIRWDAKGALPADAVPLKLSSSASNGDGGRGEYDREVCRSILRRVGK